MIIVNGPIFESQEYHKHRMRICRRLRELSRTDRLLRLIASFEAIAES